MNRLIALYLAVLGLTALNGCGGDSGQSVDASSPAQNRSTTEKSSEAATANGRSGRVTVVFRAESATLGRILFDEDGYTLYRFRGDEGAASTCYGACAEKWPPLFTEGELKARKVKFKHLGTTERRDGTLQVTYFGHPLYHFAGDENTGEASGNGLHAFGGEWRAMHPSGKDAES